VALAFVIAGSVSAVAMLAWAHQRVRAARPVRDAVPTRKIGDLCAGRFRVVGRALPVLRTHRSLIDQAECVFLERAEYEYLGSAAVPLMRELGRGMVAPQILLDDGSGRVLVDSAGADVEAATLIDSGGLVAERRIRSGEEMELVATFSKGNLESEGGPYRANGVRWQAVGDGIDRPRLSFRTDPAMIEPLDEFSGFLRGAAVLLLVLSGLSGIVSLVG
jgi:hypothetical protein